MKANDHFRCEECRAILLELWSASRADREALLASGRDLLELRREMIAAIGGEMTEFSQVLAAKSMAARRRMTEHQILTGHFPFLNGWRPAMGGLR